MTNDLNIAFHQLDRNKGCFKYVVIVAMYCDKLIWVKQHDKDTWELPAGHVEEAETPEQAARRELWEETGAVDFTLVPICDFSTNKQGNSSYNRLFYSIVDKLEVIPNFEIEKIIFQNKTPEMLTHGSIQPVLVEKALQTIGKL